METSTKEKILDVALDLFARHGYEGTSIDMIALAAGIKGPSLYKHYKSKEAILKALIKDAEDYYVERFYAAGDNQKYPENIDQMNKMIFAKVKLTLVDPKIQKTRQFLTQEQYRSPEIAELATKYNIILLQSRLKRFFEVMIDAGVLEKGHVGLLALEYAAPISVFVQLYDRFTSPSKRKNIMGYIKAHMTHFGEMYGKKKK
ncbi:MAG: TetR/AcrR family transcriptional regulator [Fibrobacter sp.]|nr:TetR/AcrR family transcriptional regulator [Fibrobacter sp.]